METLFRKQPWLSLLGRSVPLCEAFIETKQF